MSKYVRISIEIILVIAIIFVAFKLIELIYPTDNKNIQIAEENNRSLINEANLDDDELASMDTGETMEDPLTGEDKTVVGVSDDGLKFGLDWAELPPGEDPIDGNTMLDSGYTLGEVKIFMESTIKDYRSWGTPEDEIEEIVREGAKEYGTTIEELARVQVRQEDVDDVEKKIEEGRKANIASGGKGNKGSTGGNKGTSSGDKKTPEKGNSGSSGGEKKSSGGGDKLPDDIHGTPGVISDAFKDSIGAKDHEGTSDWENDTGILE